LVVRDPCEGRELTYQVLHQYISQIQYNIEGGWDDEFVKSLIKLSIVETDQMIDSLPESSPSLSSSSSSSSSLVGTAMLDRLLAQEMSEEARVKMLQHRDMHFQDQN